MELLCILGQYDKVFSSEDIQWPSQLLEKVDAQDLYLQMACREVLGNI
jgi:hypothetical protein